MHVTVRHCAEVEACGKLVTVLPISSLISLPILPISVQAPARSLCPLRTESCDGSFCCSG